MTLKLRLEKINQKNATSKLNSMGKDTSTTTWMERAYAKNNKYASAKVYSK